MSETRPRRGRALAKQIRREVGVAVVRFVRCCPLLSAAVRGCFPISFLVLSLSLLVSRRRAVVFGYRRFALVIGEGPSGRLGTASMQGIGKECFGMRVEVGFCSVLFCSFAR